MPTRLLAALLAVFAVASSAGAGAGGQGGQKSRPQGVQTTAAASVPQQQPARPKRKLTPLRSSETKEGSQLTITSTEPLNDYSAYRTGDRFNVIIPNADADAVRSGVRGRGFEDAQVQRRGNDVVLSFRVQPGAKPRVSQKFNKLDVVFAAPEGSETRAQTGGTSATTNEGGGNTKQQQTTPQQNTRDATQRNASEAAAGSPAQGQSAPASQAQEQASNPPGTETNSQPPAGETATQSSASGATAAQNAAQDSRQVADARRPEGADAPVKITAEPGTQTGTGVGATIMRNWPLALIATLLLVGLGLFLATRRTSAAEPPPVPEETKPKALEPTLRREAAAAPKPEVIAPVALAPTVEMKPEVTLAPTVETKPEVTVAPTAAVTAARVGKQSRKKRKQEKKKQTTAVAQKPAPAESAKADEAAKTVETAPVAAATVEEVEEVTAAAPRVEEASAAPALESAAPVIKEVAAPSVEEVETTAPAVEAEEVAHAIAAEEMTAAIAPVVEQPPAEAETETPAVAEAALDEAVAEAPAEAESGVEAPAVEAAVEAPAVEETAVEERAIEPLAAEESAVEDRAIEPVAAEESAAETSVEIAPVLASAGAVAAEEASAREIEPAARELSADEVEAETRRLLEGVPYERGLASVTDVVSRQIVASSLLSALAGRDETRRQRARTAFIEQGYFNETARDLRDADAPAERASAARSLGLVGDRLATSHLIAALEDPSPDVRRAAVEALASVRDPRAVMPLEALRERERRERIKLPRRLIEHTIEVCLEAARETPQPTLAEVSAASALAPAEEATAQAAETAAAEARAPEVEAATATVEPAEAQTVETSAPEASAMSEATAEDVATSFYAPRVEEESRAEVEESPALFTSDEAVAEESVSEAPAAAPVEEPPALAYGWKSETRIEPFVTQTEEEHVTTDAHAAAHASLEFETHRADERAADEAPAVEGFEPTHEAAAEEWIEVDVEEPEFAQGKGWDAPGLKEIAPVESSEAHVEPTPPVLDEAEPTPAARAVTEMEVSQTPPAYASETYTAPAASAVDKGITPFVADEMSAVPKAIQLRLASDEPEERANAITDLARVDSDDAFRTICVGFDDPSADVRNAAARSLYSLQEDRAEAFTRALREASPHRRKNIGAAIAASGLAGEALSRLTGESREKTYDAFSLLFLMAKAGEVQPLIRAVEAHPDNEVRLAVVKLLALSGQRDILPAFRRLAVRGSLPAEVRSAVMEAIYQISSSQSTTTPAL